MLINFFCLGDQAFTVIFLSKYLNSAGTFRSGQGGGGETVKSGGEQHQADSGKGMQVQRLLLLLDGGPYTGFT